MNNPLKYNDPSGEFWNLIIGGLIGGVVNWVAHGCKFNAQGLGYFAVGAIAGALGAGIAGGLNSALLAQGGTFASGFLGTTAMVTGSGFVAGAVIGAGTGLGAGFTAGFATGLAQGKNIGDCFKTGIHDGTIGAITAGIINGVVSGIQARRQGLDFWTGNGTFDSVTCRVSQRC